MAENDRESADVTVIILTLNEELNLPHAIASVRGWARRILVLDSYSTDATIAIARRLGCDVVQRAFDTYSGQRNYALHELPVDTEWVFFLDADEWMPSALKDEISKTLDSQPSANGFRLKYRLIWMGRWIRRGYYPTWILRLLRTQRGHCEDRAVNAHIVVEGDVAELANDLMHESRSGVDRWIEKHIRYAELEMAESFRAQTAGQIEAQPFGTQAERRRWLRRNVVGRLPSPIGPFVIFFYRYILRGGFLDGYPGFCFHFMQSLWFSLLVDVMRRERLDQHAPPEAGK